MTRLDLSQNSLDELPPSLLSSTSLRDLDVSLNCLARVPAFPPGSPLAKLDLRSNRLASLETERLPRDLVELKIFGPELTELPASIVDLARLHTLEFGYSVRALPDLSRLRAARLDRAHGTARRDPLRPAARDARVDLVQQREGCRHGARAALDRSLHTAAEARPDLRARHHDRRRAARPAARDLPSAEHPARRHAVVREPARLVAAPEPRQRGDDALPPRALELERLRHLSLGSNRLDALPDDLGRLAELEILELDRNQIPALPESIGRLTALRELSARSNRIASLPASMMGLSALEKLELAGNPLREIPDELRSQIEQKRRW